MTGSSLSSQQTEALTQLAQDADQKLEDAGQTGASRAFNLGCSISMLPAVILILLAFFLSRANWAFSLITALVIGLLMLGLASLAANTAKRNTIGRVYQESVEPEIRQALRELDLARSQFDNLANQVLPQRATLRRYLSGSPEPEEPDSDENPSS